MNILIMDEKHAAAQMTRRREREIKFGAICIWCGQQVHNGHENPGAVGWETSDGDSGCDLSPETTGEACGSHNTATDAIIWGAPAALAALDGTTAALELVIGARRGDADPLTDEDYDHLLDVATIGRQILAGEP